MGTVLRASPLSRCLVGKVSVHRGSLQSSHLLTFVVLALGLMSFGKVWACFLASMFAKSILLDLLQDSVCALSAHALCSTVTIYFLVRVHQATRLVITLVHRNI